MAFPSAQALLSVPGCPFLLPTASSVSSLANLEASGGEAYGSGVMPLKAGDGLVLSLVILEKLLPLTLEDALLGVDAAFFPQQLHVQPPTWAWLILVGLVPCSTGRST